MLEYPYEEELFPRMCGENTRPFPPRVLSSLYSLSSRVECDTPLPGAASPETAFTAVGREPVQAGPLVAFLTTPLATGALGPLALIPDAPAMGLVPPVVEAVLEAVVEPGVVVILMVCRRCGCFHTESAVGFCGWSLVADGTADLAFASPIAPAAPTVAEATGAIEAGAFDAEGPASRPLEPQAKAERWCGSSCPRCPCAAEVAVDEDAV